MSQNLLPLSSPARFLRKLTVVGFMSIAFATMGTLSLKAASRNNSNGDQKQEKQYEFSANVAKILGDVRTAITAKDNAKALTLLDQAIAKSKPGTYDYAGANEFKAQVLLNMNKFKEAIPSLKASLVGDFLKPEIRLVITYYLSQLEMQKGDLKQALEFYNQWDKLGGKITSQTLLYHASLLYQLKEYKKALTAVNKIFVTAHHPVENAYVIRLACEQSMSDYQAASKTLELLVKHYPKNKTYWMQLVSAYMIKNHPLAAIVAYQRAQEHGLLNTQKDNANLAGLLYNYGAYEELIDFLTKNLNDGGLANKPELWQLLGYTWEMLHHRDKTIATFEEAAKKAPSGQTNMILAQFLYDSGKPKQAYEAAARATKFKDLKKPGKTYLFMSSLAFEMKQYDKAEKDAKEAEHYQYSEKQAKDLAKAIASMKKEQEAKKKSEDKKNEQAASAETKASA